MGCLRLFPWTDPLGAADSTIHTRFLKRRALPSLLWCVSSPHARKRSAKEAPAAPLPGARQKASSLQPGTDPAADAQGCPCPAQTQPDGRSPAQGRAGGVQGNAAHSIAWGLPPARQPRPARKSPRRAAPPAQRGTRRRGRANPARWTKPGTGPGWWDAQEAAGRTVGARQPGQHQEEGRPDQAARNGITSAPRRSVSR